MLRKAFVVYLLSHNRPMAEVLAPQRRDISVEYTRGFGGMVERPVSLDELLKVREDLICRNSRQDAGATQALLSVGEKG